MLEEHVQVEATLLNEVLLRVTCFAFWRGWGDVEAWMALEEDVSEKVELSESSLDLKSPLSILAKDSVDDVVTALCPTGIANAESLSELVTGERFVD